MEYVTLGEAATFLGVSKATLRNWDRAGKLKAVRHPVNRYRVYPLSELHKLQRQLPALESGAKPSGDLFAVEEDSGLTLRSAKRLIARLHATLRDHDGNSNIIERFDELTKVLFLKMWTEENDCGEQFFTRLGETPSQYVERLRALYRQASAENRHIIPEAFSNFSASDAALKECAEGLAGVTFRGLEFDVKGLAYEEVIKRTFDKGDHQQFFTPPEVVKFVVDFLGDRISGDVCDPAAGTGGFLVEVAKRTASYRSLTAFEIDERLAWVSGINLFTHGATSARSVHLKDGGTLGKNARSHFESFDVVLTNPPFGSDFTDALELRNYKLGAGRTTRRRGILFLERCHQLLRKDGVLAIILDEGVLNLPSAEDVRLFLLQNFELLGIVGLPETAFMPYATVNASILFLKKSKHARGAQVFFAKPENVGRKSNGDEDYIYGEHGTARLNSDFPEIIKRYDEYKRSKNIEPDELAYAADVHENLRDDDNGRRLDFRFHHPSRHRSQLLLESARTKLVTLAEICFERNATVIPSSELQDQVILYTGLAHIESGSGVARQLPTPANSLKSAVKRYEPGDIVFAKMRPNLRKVAYLDFPEGGYVSPECIVLQVRRDQSGDPLVDPLLLSTILRSDLVYGQIMHLIAGIGRPRLSAGDLRRVRIPVPDVQSQQRWRESFLGQLHGANLLKSNAEAMKKEAAELEHKAVESLAAAFVMGK